MKSIITKALGTFIAGSAASAALIYSWPGNWDFRSLWSIGLVGSGSAALAGAVSDLSRKVQSSGKSVEKQVTDAILERLKTEAAIPFDQVIAAGDTIARLQSSAIAPTAHQNTNGQVPTPPAPLDFAEVPKNV
jgi:hypothetical protein